MPALRCDFCSLSLLDSASSLPENVHLIRGKCKADCEYYLTRHHQSTEDGSGLGRKDFAGLSEEPRDKGTDIVSEEVVERVCQIIPESRVPICEASTSEAHYRLRNRKSLIVSGLAETEGRRPGFGILFEPDVIVHPWGSCPIFCGLCLSARPKAK